MTTYKLFINGGYVDASDGKTANSLNPATGEVFAVVHQAGAKDIDSAIAAAEAAFPAWQALQPSVRESLFLKAADIMEERANELRDILVDEAGSTLIKAGYETHHTPVFIRGMAGECRRVTGDTYTSDYVGVHSYSIRKPLGIVTAISPFNFPLLLGIRKIGWALAAGNCVLLKPSEMTPVIALTIAEIFDDAGFPPGVLNVLPGSSRDMGDALISDPRIKKVTFTGSTEVGKSIAAKCALNLKKYTLELGGKNPLVILDDADLEYAVNTAAFCNFMHQGQVCMTGSRIIVEKGIYKDFCRLLAEKVQQLKTGNPRDQETVVGPLIRGTQASFIQKQVDAAVNAGAVLLCGGSYVANYYQPTVLADITPEMSVFSTECFGPVASVVRAENVEHAIALTNNNVYGLSAAVLTNDLQKAMMASEQIEAGMVHINGPTIRDEAIVPFGGVKDSGIGREGGQFAMNEFTELKWITVQKGQQKYPF